MTGNLHNLARSLNGAPDRALNGALPDRHFQHWSDAEEGILRAWYPLGGLPSCMEKLPGRSRIAIDTHAKILGLCQLTAKASAEALRLRQDASEALARLALLCGTEVAWRFCYGEADRIIERSLAVRR